ncbi:isoprenoid synthase domain-containing protein [Desarmillaria tabescens]|uniref:Isoprenoid synthase domain-containing protein n=1 Tax=Armillaria tabescens TaxID=1929756 RepID=A0AA39JKQ9_ARMTA|nr:isoprenoid synthase domain-containing protein [Desarmillaria tabescens]KAK0442258.1 isoprenoid synthase domain-containing protein [Desarmillaria tabescens]
MAPSRVGPHTIQCRRLRSWASSLSNLAGRALGLPNLPRRQTTEDIMRSFLHHFDTTNLPPVEDAALEDLCTKEAERRGYALDALKPYLTVGLNITASAYHHLVNVDVKVYIVFFTAFATYFDDVYPDDPDALIGVPNFTKYFASSEKQPTKMLDDFANVLAETPQLFGDVAADFIVQAGLRFITGLILEIRSKSEPTHKVDRYTVFLRELSGIAEAYTIFMFPKDLPYNLYVQALPLLRDVINFTNDITSFYKEECEGETHNLISLLAEARAEPKSEALRYVAEQCIQAHERVLCILSPHQEVRSSYENFFKGYMAFYLGAKRYRLSELNL